MIMRNAIALFVAAAILVAVGAQVNDKGISAVPLASSGTNCEVGNDATLDTQRTAPGSGEAVVGRVVVLGCQWLRSVGRLEVVNFRTRSQSCVSVDYPDQMASEPLGCVKRKSPRWPTICPAKPVCPSPVGWTDSNTGMVSRVNGFIDRQGTSIQIFLRRNGRRVVIDAHLISIAKRWSRALDLPSRMSVFVSSFGGCPPRGRITAEARLGASPERKVERSVPNLLPWACAEQAQE